MEMYNTEGSPKPKKKNQQKTEVKNSSKSTVIKIEGKSIIVPNFHALKELEQQVNTLRIEMEKISSKLHQLNITMSNIKADVTNMKAHRRQ